MFDINQYRENFLQEVKVTAENTKNNTVASFVEVAASKLFNAEVITDYYPSFYTGIGRNNRRLNVHGYVKDDWDNSFSLIVADYFGQASNQTLTLTESKAIFGRVTALIKEIISNNLIEKIEISMPIYDMISEMVRCYNNSSLRKIKIILVTDKFSSTRIGAIEKTSLNSISIEYHIWDINRFFKIETSKIGKQEIEIDFLEYTPNGLPCIEASDASFEGCKSYLCVIPGSVLADVYDRYGSLLLEGNVRSFLSVRGKVNKSIRSTIISKEKAPLFFCLNNGISVTATEAYIEKNNCGTFLRYLQGMQIVNGGQTTASLSNARYKDKADLSSIYVQMKLTKVSNHNAESLIPQISKSANSQNKVNEADFFSNHPFHIRIEDFSRRKYAPSKDGQQYETHWFYERARGQYTQMQMRKTKSQINKFKLQNPKNQVITKTNFAKVRNSWDKVPYIVSKGAQASFLYYANIISTQWSKDESMFNEIYFQESVGLYILFKEIEKLVSSQEWYEGGYRANIVTYSIALFAENLDRQFKNRKLNLSEIWLRQEVPEVIVSNFIIIIKKVFEAITDDERPVMNVTQWCKRKECWNLVKEITIELFGLNDFMISNNELKTSQRKAKKEQKILNGIEAQIFVVNIGTDYWRDMYVWGSKIGVLSDSDKKILQIAYKMSSSRMPNSVHCTKLQGLRNRMINEGFRTK